MPVQTLNLEDRETVRVGFWKRQFQPEATYMQRKFDWAFGVVMPVVCFAFDPIVFKGGMGEALLGQYRPFAYLLSYVSIMAMMAWLLFGERLKWLNALLAGLFAVGGLISLGVGLLLLPFSLLGLIFLIGALGLTPLFSAVIYLRNARRAFATAAPFLERRVLVPSFLLAALFSAVIPLTINTEIRKELDKMRFGSVERIHIGSTRLRYLAPLVDCTPLAIQYYGSDDFGQSERGKALAEAFREITGKDIEYARPID